MVRSNPLLHRAPVDVCMLLPRWFYFVSGVAGRHSALHVVCAIFLNLWVSLSALVCREDRCRCIATMLCCHQQVVRPPDGRRPPIRNIAELTAGKRGRGCGAVAGPCSQSPLQAAWGSWAHALQVGQLV